MIINRPVYVYDIETDGLLDQVTKIHCLSYSYRDKENNVITKSITDYEDIKEFFTKDCIRVGHNITLYDERVIAKILGIDTLKTKSQIIDTLALSWYLYPEHLKHSLEEWGVRIGTSKVKISDWKNLSIKEYTERCEIDTIINLEVWELFFKDLMDVYGNLSSALRLIEYLQFKMDCIREQEEVKLRIDLDKLLSNLNKLKILKSEKESVLQSIMPKVPVKKAKKYKDVIVVSDKEIYEKGDLMYEHYKSLGYKIEKEYELFKITGYKEPNANSVDQKKSWLFSLGWKPINFSIVKEDGKERKVPQITAVDKSGICQSVKNLYEKEPKLEVLDGLSILTHRIGVLEGIYKNQKFGFIEASALGFTNTLRLRHTNVVNLPVIDKPYGKEIREIFIANEGMILCGSDMSSLEDSTKQHYIYNYDPVYVNEMRTPGFDPHLDIAVLSGMLTEEQSDEHKLYSNTKGKEGVNHKVVRHKAKTTNFSATYGASPGKIALTAGIPLKEAKLLHSIYWKRNAAVKKTAESALVKDIKGKKWIYNPVSKFWYSLRAEKDRFSTLNQSTGVYCFDNYIMACRKRGIKISLQMHDEELFNLIDKELTTNILEDSIKEVNEIVKLNVPLSISIDYGLNYADCH